MKDKKSVKEYASVLHTDYMVGLMNQGMKRGEASRKAYKMVGQDLKILIGENYEEIPDSIARMTREFQGKKRKIKRDYREGNISRKHRYSAMKRNWTDIQKKYDTKKVKSLKFSKEKI